jgi:sensor histidine kinase regulating citrate/malate metabolism
MMSFYEYVSIMNESISRIMTFPVIIMIIYIVAKLIKVSVSAHEYEHISDLLSVQLENHIEYYCKITDIYNEFRCFRHDFDNHLICLRKLVSERSTEQALDYMDGMNSMCRSLRENYDTGNIIADAILNDKSIKARSSGTEIEFKGFVPTMGILNVDLCTILSNVLDNAVEACEKGDKAISKTITVDSEFSQGYYFLSISNPVFEKVRIEKNGKIKTSKEDKMLHGWGIANVIKAVKKYDGTSDFTVDDKTFTFHAELKLKENEC